LTEVIGITVLAYVIHRISKAHDVSASNKILAQNFIDTKLDYFGELIVQYVAAVFAVE
jgi:hypothetical protein